MRVRAAFLSALVLGTSSVALAGPNESPADFSVNPANPDFMVLRYEYSQGGVVMSEDAGQTWKMMCSGVAAASAWPGDTSKSLSDTYGLAVASDGSFFTGDFNGMLAARKSGCEWTFGEGVPDNWVVGLAVDPVTPTRVLAITGQGAKANGLHAYDATTQQWTALGTQEMIGISSFELVPSGTGLRVYEAIYRDYTTDGIPIFIVRYSENDGATWTEHIYPGTIEGDLRVIAVDQNNPDRIAVAEVFGRSDPRPDVIWINDQAGDPGAFTQLFTVGRLGGAVFDANGALFVGDSKGELYKADPGATEPETIGSMLAPRCLDIDQDGVFRICQVDGFGELDPTTGEFTSLVNFNDINEDISLADCSAEGIDVAAVCEQRLGNDGWCVASHWPKSHLCSAYNYPGLAALGIDPATLMSGGGTGGMEMMTGGALATGGMPATGAEAATGGTVAPATGGVAATGAVPAASGGQVSSGGGSSGGCSTSGNGAAGRESLAFVALGLGLLWTRRRR